MHVQLGKEVSITMPQAIVSDKRYPGHKQSEFTDLGLLNSTKGPSVALVDLIVETVQGWLNEDPLLWCQYGAKLKLHKLANVYTLTLYPYPQF